MQLLLAVSLTNSNITPKCNFTTRKIFFSPLSVDAQQVAALLFIYSCHITAILIEYLYDSRYTDSDGREEVTHMYRTEQERRNAKLPSYYTAPELDQMCARYFEDCDSQERSPTLPGLLVYLGVTDREWSTWMEGAPGYTRHPAVCQKALLEMRDRLEQRRDTAAIFLLKQRPYGGYSDRPEPDSAGGIKIHVSFGKDKRNSTK